MDGTDSPDAPTPREFHHSLVEDILTEFALKKYGSENGVRTYTRACFLRTILMKCDDDPDKLV